MIVIHSTEKRAKVPFEPRRPGEVYMYVCGPTVYDRCHVGHARPAVVFDTVRRYLEFAGYAVTFMSNITDIDDKIIRRAGELGISCAQLASRHQDEYETDMARLGVRSPTIRPKATEHIPAMIDLIRTLEGKGVAYTTSRGVWFDVAKFSEYGRLSGKVVDDEATEHRVETDPEKRNPQDFALWKFGKPGEPEWPSPWGAGRPGWHIECSAMSGKFCGMELDIHGGGADLCFPHHENELAQSEAATGKRFVNYWMHNGFITVAAGDDSAAGAGAGAEDGSGGVKMGKSKGNAFWLREAFALADPSALRMWILGTHYRAPLLYKPTLLQSAQAGLNRIYTCLEALANRPGDTPPAPPSYWLAWANAGSHAARAALGVPDDGTGSRIIRAGQAFAAAMDDDFNTPQALAAVHELVNGMNACMDTLPAPDAYAALEMLRLFLGVLGLPLERPHGGGAGADDLIQLLVDLRTEARKEKNFALGDRIRDALADLRIELKDGAGGTAWTVHG